MLILKIKVIKDETLPIDTVIINCNTINDNVNEVINILENYDNKIVGKINNEKYFLQLSDIFYFEAVDNKVFAYTEKEVYEINYKILELIDKLRDTSFIQTSRTIILNIDKIDHMSSLINGRILAVLLNKEKQIITRAYALDFKNKLARR